VGVNAFGTKETQGLNFAISAKEVRAFMSKPAEQLVSENECKSRVIFEGRESKAGRDISIARTSSGWRATSYHQAAALPLSIKAIEGFEMLKAIIRISASVGAMPRSLCRPRRFKGLHENDFIMGHQN
jgi:hypothetical protein